MSELFGNTQERRWYIVQTYSGYENKVKANLDQRIATMGMEDRIFRVLVPVEEKVTIKDGKTKRVKRKVFPSYVPGRNDTRRPVLVCRSPYAWGHGLRGLRQPSYPAFAQKKPREIMRKLGKRGQAEGGRSTSTSET